MSSPRALAVLLALALSACAGAMPESVWNRAAPPATPAGPGPA